MNRTKHILITKHALYSLILLFLYVIQTTPGVFSIFGSKPIWVIPFAVALSMFEGEFVGGIYGAVAGLLCDMSGFSLLGRIDNIGGYSIFGFNGLVVCICCVAAGLLVIYLMRCNLFGCLIFVGALMLLRGSLDVLFSYQMWGYDSVWKVYVFQMIPCALYTTAVSPLMFWLVRRLYGRFDALLKKR